jgi:hypothetical protein
MDDITPLNLQDSPKLFGLRYDQLIACMISLVVSTQLYAWISPIPFAGHDLRADICIVLGLLGPAYCLVTLNQGGGYWDSVINFYMSCQVYIPGPDPNPVRFLKDEEVPEFGDDADDEIHPETLALLYGSPAN